jgi:hypothetical protein
VALIEPVSVNDGGAVTQLTVRWVGVAVALAVTVPTPPLLPALPQRSLYAATSEACAPGLSSLISPQPPPAFATVTRAPATALCPALVKLTAWTGPVLPEE